MNILIAPDSFKESLQAMQVCHAIKAGMSQVFPDANYTLLPLADGGEGTSNVLSYVLKGQWQQAQVCDPLMRPITAKYFLTHDGMAIIETAEACGLHLLTINERNPLITTSYGVGEIMTDAIDKGATQMLIGLGGSATNDAGTGMLQALGARLLDKHRKQIAPGGAHLIELNEIDAKAVNDKLASINIQVACDVTSPLYGFTGSSHVFGPQKGATPDDVLILDKALAHFAAMTNFHNISEDCSKIEGAGAAGGLGFAFMAYCRATLTSGFETLAEMVKLSKQLAHADLVITGEGRLDAQTAMGKVANGVAVRAKTMNLNVPVIAICGSVDRDLSNQNCFDNSPFDIILPSIQKPDRLENILSDAYLNVVQTAYQLAAALKIGYNLKEN